MTHRALSVLLVLAVASTADAQSPPALAGRDRWADSARVEIEAANTAADLARLRAAKALLDRALTAFPGDPLLQHYLGYALYRESSMMQGMKEDAKTVRPLLEQADTLLARSSDKLPMPETFALRSSVIGQLIGDNPLRGMTMGPRSTAAMDRALELGASNPRVWLLRGMGAMFTPSTWGGGVDKAQGFLEKAVTLFAGDHPAPPAPAWGEPDAHIWLGQAYQRQGRLADARRAYQRALALQPDNQWVRNVLLPAVDRASP